jgi:hypothetical protein
MLVVGPATAAADPILEVTKLFQNDYPELIDSSKRSIAEFGCTLTAYAMVFNYEMGKLGLHKKNPDGTSDGPLSYTPSDLNRLLNEYRYEQPTYKKDPDTGKTSKSGSVTTNGWAQPIGPDGKPDGSTTIINIGALLKAVEQASRADSFEHTGLKQDTHTNTVIPPNGKQVDGTTAEILDQLKAGHPVLARVDNDTHTVLITGWDDAKGYLIADPFQKPDNSSELELSAYQNLVFALENTIFKGGGPHTPFEVPSDYFIPLDALEDRDINPDLFGPQAFRENHVPEPASGVLVLAGLLVFAGSRKSRERTTESGERATKYARAV